jgi:hypothetical protein
VSSRTAEALSAVDLHEPSSSSRTNFSSSHTAIFVDPRAGTGPAWIPPG